MITRVTSQYLFPSFIARLAAAAVMACAAAWVAHGGQVVQAQAGGASVAVKGTVRANPTPAWGKGILPLTPESYYNAIECGKQDVADPPCVFWDTGLCKNDDFQLAWYTPYKQVAYEVWTAVHARKPAPQPNYQAALKTRVTIGITPVKGGKNTLKQLTLKRAGKPVEPVDRSVSGGGGRYTFDTPVLAPTADVTLELVGSERTISCAIPTASLKMMR